MAKTFWPYIKKPMHFYFTSDGGDSREHQPLCSELDSSLLLAKRSGGGAVSSKRQPQSVATPRPPSQSPDTATPTTATLSSRRFCDNVSLGKPLKQHESRISKKNSFPRRIGFTFWVVKKKILGHKFCNELLIKANYWSNLEMLLLSCSIIFFQVL